MGVTTRYLLGWIPMVFIGIANGVFREVTYGEHLTELRAHQVSTLTALVLFGLYIWCLIRVWRLESSKEAIGIGLMWLALTVVFEFVFGHFVAGHTWTRLLHDYNLLAGRVWGLVLVCIAVAPIVFYRLERKH